MEIFVAAIILILVIKFGWWLIVACLNFWPIALLLLAAIIWFFGA